MNTKRFWSVWTPFAFILTAIAIACTCVLYYYSDMMYLLYGRGARRILSAEEGLDAEYYEIPFSSSEEAAAHGMELTRRISESGQVLLKNDGILPLSAGEDVTPFGYHCLAPNYGPVGGSANMGEDIEVVSAEAALSACFSVNETVTEAMRSSSAMGMTSDGYCSYPDEAMPRVDIVEYPPEVYDGTEESCRGTVGIVFLGRAGSEGSNGEIYPKPLCDGTPHAAALSVYEKEAIARAKAYCRAVVVVLNCSNPIDLSELMCEGGEYEANAILLIGGTGSTGFLALADILTGAVSPSGRLADIYVTDSAKSPSYVNFGGDAQYTNVTKDPASQIYSTYLEYEEGIYSGYRYYETACIEDEDFVYGELTPEGAILVAGEVTYPFGYGLSYTEFEQRIVRFDAEGDVVTVEVEVKNTGGVAGAEAVQIYCSAPYTAFDAENGIEKSAVVLAGFAKTDVLAPGEDACVRISFAKEDMASYFESHPNADGSTGCYMLEEGEYEVSLRKNSHDVIETRTYSVGETIYYEGQNVRESDRAAQLFARAGAEGSSEVTPVNNKFGYMTEYMRENAVCLSRSDWKGTQPTAAEDKPAPESVLAMLENNRTFDPATDAALGDAEGSLVYAEEAPRSCAEEGLTFSDLRGEPFASPAWDALLDKLDYSASDLADMLHLGYMHTGAVESVALPATEERDGPLGLTATTNDSQSGQIGARCYYCSPLLLAMSFDVSLAYEYGESVAWEAALFNDGKTPVSGWYAPGINLHRGAFGGRYYEYFSEDPLLTGLLAARIAEGASDNGLTVLVKHFAANNQDTKREGLMVWMTEQTLRELYLRPFELCIKQGRSRIAYTDTETGELAWMQINAVRGVMTAKNSLGSVFCGVNPALLRGVLEGEWGFCGMVISDLVSRKSSALCAKMFRAGVDVLMVSRRGNYAVGMDSPTAQNIIRESVRAVCYALVNSNATQGVPPGARVVYGIAPWEIVLWCADGAAGAVILGGTAAGAVLSARRRRADRAREEQ